MTCNERSKPSGRDVFGASRFSWTTGANPLAVEKLVGHKLPPIIERYWHPSPTVLLEALSRLDRILGLSYSPATAAR